MISLEFAGPQARPVIEALFQLYTHDFSEFWADDERGELDETGRFEPYPHLDDYWGGGGRTPLLIRNEGRLAGFALINAVGHSGLPLDHNMAEFFVVRKHRRAGVGTRAARAIFASSPGVWEVAVARRNRPALAFWRQAILGLEEASDLQEFGAEGSDWDGPILRFRAS